MPMPRQTASHGSKIFSQILIASGFPFFLTVREYAFTISGFFLGSMSQTLKIPS
jgi:hypothetical protein